MTTVALTRCAYGITLPAGVNNVWTTALRCWANRKSCHVLTLGKAVVPWSIMKRQREGCYSLVPCKFLKKQEDTTNQSKQATLHALSQLLRTWICHLVKGINTRLKNVTPFSIAATLPQHSVFGFFLWFPGNYRLQGNQTKKS